MMRLSVVIALFASSVSASTYSISYSGLDSSSTIKRDGSAAISVEGALSARHVADIICRLNGLPPLIEEAAIRMPSLDTSLGTFTPLIVEVKNAVEKPADATTVLSYTFPEKSQTTPSLPEVLHTLRAHGINAEIKSNMDLKDFNRPVVFLHLDGDDHQARRLATATRSSTTTVSISPLTEFQISNYQITLWTAVFFIMLIYAAVYMVADMEVIPDSLLFAKFQSSRTGGRTD